jgi:hypothetical protein
MDGKVSEKTEVVRPKSEDGRNTKSIGTPLCRAERQKIALWRAER